MTMATKPRWRTDLHALVDRVLFGHPHKTNPMRERHDLAYQREIGLPMLSELTLSRAGMIRFQGRELPVATTTATVEVSGSTTRTGGLVINLRHDDRKFLLVLTGPEGTFHLPISGRNGSKVEHKVRAFAAHINETNS